MYLSSFHQQIENTMYYNVLTQTATLLLLFTKYCSSQFDGLGSVPGQSVPPSNPFLAGTGTGGSLGNRGQQFGTSPRITSSNIADIDWSAIDRRDEENWYHLYPFGEKYLDSNNNGRPWNDQQIDLDFFYPFGGFRYNYTYIFPEGFVAFSYPDYVQPPYTFPRPNWPDEYDPAFIAAFMIDQQLMHVGDHMLSNVWYRIISRPPALIGKSNQDGNTNLQPPRGTINAATGAADRYYAGHLLRASEGRVEDPALLDRIEVDIRNAMVGARGSRFDYALIVTWERMGYGGAPKFTALNQYEHVKRWQNTYQMVLATDEDRSYVMFNYANINWTSATSAGALFGRGGKQSALVGFNAGNGTGFMELPYSAEGNSYKLVQFGSSPTAGRWAARVDELFIYGGCTNESTGTMVGHIGALPMLGGISFNISGPCFRPTDRIKLQIDELTLPCVRMSMTIARCVIPIHAIYRSGIVDAKVSIDGGQSYPFWRKSLILPPSRMRESIRLIDDPVDTNNNWMSLTPEKLLLKWNKHNITFDPNKRLNLYLYGYWEDVASHNMEPVALIGEGIENKGSYEFSPSQLDRWHMSLLDDAWKKYLGGMLQLRIEGDDWADDAGALTYWCQSQTL